MMNSGGFGGNNHHTQPMAEINTTPMVDVMLVLLVIFIITAPLLTHAVKIDLPQASSQPNPEKPDTITLLINAEGKLFWNDALFEEARACLAIGGRGAETTSTRTASSCRQNNKLPATGNGYVGSTKRRNRKTWLYYRAGSKGITKQVYVAEHRPQKCSQQLPCV